MKFTINRYEFEIISVDKDDERLVVNDCYKIGSIHYDTCKIYIADYLPPQIERATVIHELTHAFVSAYGMLAFEEFNHECLCEFVSCHSESIIELANEYFALRGNYETFSK